MNIRTLLLVVFVAVASVVATLGLTGRKADSSQTATPAHEETESAASEEATPTVPGLELATAVAGEGWATIPATGNVVIPPERLVKIGPRISGKVVFARGTIGEAVRRGQVLAVISSLELGEARASLRLASAKLTASTASLNREKRYAQAGEAANDPVDEARSALLAVQSELSDAKGDLLVARNELAQVEAEKALCRTRLDRARELFAEQIVSRQDLETAQAEYAKDGLEVEVARSKVAQVQNRVEKAAALVEIGKQQVVRRERVRSSGTANQRILQTAEAEVAAGRADVQAAQDKIRVLGASPSGSGDRVSVISPSDGRIVARRTNVGEMATPESVLFEVADLSEVWIETKVFEKDLAGVKIGQPIEAEVVAYPGRLFSGRIASIDDVVQPESRTVTVRCTIRNEGGLLRGGMLAEASIVTARRKGAVLIPGEAIIREAGESYVYTPCLECEEDQAAKTNACGAYDKVVVELGPKHGRQVEILKGLDPGIQVVTVGNHQLKAAYSSGKLEAGCTDGH